MQRGYEIIKATRAYAELCAEYETGSGKHAYIFESADFAALNVLASLFISLTETGGADERVIAKIAARGYLDIMRLPEENKGGKMDVSDVSRILDSAYLQPYELNYKYYVIAASEPLSAPVQNKLLKTLEEPPASARFIIFSAGGDLLPTVKSRCRTVRLEPFTVRQVADELTARGADEATAVILAAIARGNETAAEKMLGDRGYVRAYEAALNFLTGVKRSPQILPACAEITRDKDKIPAFIDYMEIILRDIVAYREVGADAIVLKPATSEILALSREFDTRTVLTLMPLLTRARERLRLNGSAVSVADELLFSILEVKAKCLK